MLYVLVLTDFDICYVLIRESSCSRLRGREIGSGKTVLELHYQGKQKNKQT